MRFHRTPPTTRPVAISEGVRGRRPSTTEETVDGPPLAPRRGLTGLMLAVGGVLIAAALLIPNGDGAVAFPGDALQPVVPVATTEAPASRGSGEQGAPTVGDPGLADASGPGSLVTPTSPGEAAPPTTEGSWRAVDPNPPTAPSGARRGPGPQDGSSSASVAGDELARAAREEARRRTRAAAARRSKARRAAAERRRRAERARAAGRRASPPARTNRPAPVVSTPVAPAPVPARAAPPRAAAPARAPAPRRKPSGSPSQEFGGGL